MYVWNCQICISLVKDQQVICKINSLKFLTSDFHFKMVFSLVLYFQNNNKKFQSCSEWSVPFVCYNFSHGLYTWDLPYVCVGICDQLSASSEFRFDYANAPAIHCKLIISDKQKLLLLMTLYINVSSNVWVNAPD